MRFHSLSLDDFISPEPMSGCWIWIGARAKRDYGRKSLPHGRAIAAHRWVWELLREPIPPGCVLCHRCDNTSCVNPAHMFVGTVADNNNDMARKGRVARMRGEANGRAILTTETAMQIRLLRQSGVRSREIQARLGVPAGLVDSACHERRWRHLGIDIPRRAYRRRAS